MGFRSGVYCTVWEVKPKTNGITEGRISISKKNKMTDEYETDFSGFVAFVGSAAAQKALKLQPQDRIRIGDCEVTNTYDKEKRVTYWNPRIFSFETRDEFETAKPNNLPPLEHFVEVQGDEIEDEGLPF